MKDISSKLAWIMLESNCMTNTGVNMQDKRDVYKRQCQTREGLSCSYKHCLDNMFVAEEAFRVFKIMNNAG